MGFDSYFVSDYPWFNWPDWFIKAWEERVFFKPDKSGCIASKDGLCLYKNEFLNDLHKVIKEQVNEHYKEFYIVVMHENNQVEKVLMNKDAIIWQFPEPTEEWVDDDCS